MARCNESLERYIREKHEAELSRLSGEARFLRKLALMLDALTIELHEEDAFLGYFNVDVVPHAPHPFADELPTPEQKERRARLMRYGSRTSVDRAHTLVDYERILKEGLSGYARRIDDAITRSPENTYLLAMRDTLALVEGFLCRVCAELDGFIAREASPTRRERIAKIKRSLERVPFLPAEDFRDALQSVWIVHFLTPLTEDAWYSISLGAFDKYVYPYYLRSREAGMTREEAKEMLRELFTLLNCYADGACALNVGGEEYNELSLLLIECQRDFGFPGPILAARVTDHTPEGVWDMLIDEALFSRGQPTFYGEASCIAALVEKGIPKEKAQTFANNSCMGISLAGEEFNSMWGCIFCVPSALEAALCGGTLQTRETDLSIPNIPVVNSLEGLYTAFEACADYLLDLVTQVYDDEVARCEASLPDPFISLLTEGCIEKGCDRISGAHYHNVTVECMGLVNAADGISAVDHLVFKEKKYTLAEINQAVKNNFADAEALRHDLLSAPKFGQNGEGDAYAVRVAEILVRLIRKHDRDNRIYAPSLHTLDVNVEEGGKWGAGYDGRRAGEPFAKNGGASNAVRTPDPTSLILSATKLPQHKLFGGQPLDVSFDGRLVREHKKEIAALISTYLKRGGLQFQVNSLSSATLRAAIAEPEKYPDLVVRVGGFSLYFRSLSAASKVEFVERFEKEGR